MVVLIVHHLSPPWADRTVSTLLYDSRLRTRCLQVPNMASDHINHLLPDRTWYRIPLPHQSLLSLQVKKLLKNTSSLYTLSIMKLNIQPGPLFCDRRRTEQWLRCIKPLRRPINYCQFYCWRCPFKFPRELQSCVFVNIG